MVILPRVSAEIFLGVFSYFSARQRGKNFVGVFRAVRNRLFVIQNMLRIESPGALPLIPLEPECLSLMLLM